MNIRTSELKGAVRAIAIALAATACQAPPQQSPDPSPSASPSSGVVITLDRNSYSPGSNVELRITNHTSDTLGFNPCTRSVERQEGNRWISVGEPNRVCTMQLYLLEPHQTRTERTDLPSSLTRGTYRLVLTMTRENRAPAGGPPGQAPSLRAASDPFQVG